MQYFKKTMCVILATVISVLCLVGCGDKYKDAYIYFELLEKPLTLDAQKAFSDSELLIVRNIYEGLLRRGENGEIVCGVAESYTYENMVYSFKLRQDAFWSDGTPVTADDFVFAFRRAVDPKINAPFANRLMCIEGAQAINDGVADVSTLGVSAPDKYTFNIKLCSEDSNFIETLTSSVCMPCNEDFFDESIGKYGLDADYIISNGSYRLTKWNKEDFGIRLYKNEDYSGSFEVNNAAVFISCIDEETQVSRLAEGNSDMAFMPCSQLEEAEKSGLKTVGVQNIFWLLTISREYSPEVRRALAMAYSSDNYSNMLKSGFETAISLYPEILGCEDTTGVGVTTYDIEGAKALMTSQISQMEDKRFPAATLYYYDIDGIHQVATGIVGHWQQNLSTFINIQASNSLNSLKNELNESSLSFALFPITVTGTSLDEYLMNFSSAAGNTVSEIQQNLLDDNTLLPVAFQNTNISYVDLVENVTVEDFNGYIDFSFVIKNG